MFTGILGWVGGCDLKHGQYKYIYIFTQRSVSDLNILYIYIKHILYYNYYCILDGYKYCAYNDLEYNIHQLWQLKTAKVPSQ